MPEGTYDRLVGADEHGNLPPVVKNQIAADRDSALEGRTLPEGGTEGQIVSRTAEGAAWMDAPKGGVFDPADKNVRHETFHYQLEVETSEVFTPKMDRRVLYWDLVGHREDEGEYAPPLREYLMTPHSVEGHFTTLPLTLTLPGESDPQVDSEGNVVWLPEYTLVITGGATVIQWPENVHQIGEPFFNTTATLARQPDGGWRLTWQPSHKPVVSLYNPIFMRFWDESSRDLSSLSMEEADSVVNEYDNTLADVVGYDVRRYISSLDMFAVENHQALTPVTLSSFFGLHDGYLRIVSVKMPGGPGYERRTLIADYLNVPPRELTEATRNMGLRSNTEGDMLYWEGTSWFPYSPHTDDVTRLSKQNVGSAGASRYDTSRDKPFWVRGFDANGHPKWVDAIGRTPDEHDESPNSGSMLVLNSPADYERNGRVKSVGVGVFFASHGRPLWLIQESGVWFWIDAVGTKIMEAPASPSVTSPTWTLHATVPTVAQESTEYARRVQTLTPYDGRLYVGYGDYGDNTGPCDIISVGADGSIQTHLSGVPTESVETIRAFDGALFIPSIDPSWYFGPGGLTTNYGGTWRTIEIRPDMVHAFDFAMTSDGAWWVCGSSLSDTDSQVGHASVLRSTDKGATWTKVRRSETESSWSRYYWIRTDGTYVYVDDASADGAPTYYRSSDGTSWEAVITAPADPLDTLHPVLSTIPMPQGATSRSVARLKGVWYVGGDDGMIYRLEGV